MERGLCTPPKHNWCSNPRHLGGALQDSLQYISVCLVLGSLKSYTVLHMSFCSRGTGFGAYVCKRKKNPEDYKDSANVQKSLLLNLQNLGVSILA